MENQKLTKENLPEYLAAFIKKDDLHIDRIAKSIGCSSSTLNRVLQRKTLANDNLIKQCGILFELGIKRYQKLTDAEKEKISERIGSASGVGLGFASISAAVSSVGSVGLSAAGITSGLSALGTYTGIAGIAGGAMVGGVIMTAAIPIAAGAAGYGMVKGVKSIFTNIKTKDNKIDTEWEQEKLRKIKTSNKKPNSQKRFK